MIGIPNALLRAVLTDDTKLAREVIKASPRLTIHDRVRKDDILKQEHPGHDAGDLPDEMPLIHLARSAEMLGLLVEAGADPNDRDCAYQTFLMRRPNLTPALVQELKARGADMDALDEDRMTALHHTTSFATRDVEAKAKMLLEAGATVDALDARGWTPLMYACHRKEVAGLVRVLLQSGADPHRMDGHGNTPLFSGAVSSEELARAFTDAGANLALQDDGGVPLLRYAADMLYRVASRTFMQQHDPTQELSDRVAAIAAFLEHDVAITDIKADRVVMERALVTLRKEGHNDTASALDQAWTRALSRRADMREKSMVAAPVRHRREPKV